MERYQNNIQDLQGDAISGVTVTVRRVSDGGLATLFSDNAGSSKSNPFTNDADGEFFFYAADNRYDIFFTGPITDQKDDVLLLDVLTTGNTLRVNADINTATPPTTETVSAIYQIFDLANDDELASFGYIGSNRVLLRNYMEAGEMRLQGTQAGGGLVNLFIGAPDGAAELYNSGLLRFDAHTTGRTRVFSDGNTDAEQRSINLCHADNTVRSQVGNIGDDVLRLRNLIHGGNVTLDGEDAGGNPRTFLVCDPDGNTQLSGDANLELRVNVSETSILCVANSVVILYTDNIERFRTTSETLADQISGARVLDAAGSYKPVGLGVSAEIALSGTGTQTYFSQGRAGATIYWTGGSATNLDTFASTGGSQTNIPNGAWWALQNNGAGALTLRGGSGVTIRHWDGLGSAPPDEDVLVPRGAMALIRKVSDTVYDFSHNGP